MRTGFILAGVSLVGLLSLEALSAATTGATPSMAPGAIHAAKPAPSAAPALFQGTVALVSDSRLVLATRTERRTFLVPANTRIIVNRAEASLGDVVPGQLASVAGSNSNGQLVANFIHAIRQY